MSTTNIPPRKDALLDAYRQASDREGGRPGAHVRSAVLAHARVVAQSRPSAMLGSTASTISQAVRDAPAANDRAPLWRLAAGVVIGLVGVWIFQLTRPSATQEIASASVSGAVTAPAPQVATTPAEPAVAAKLATVVPAEPSVAAAAAAPTPVLAPATTASRASNESRTRSMAAPALPEAPDNKVALRDAAADRARPENSVALAKIPTPAASPTPEIASASAADAATSEMMIASVETRKSARAPAPASVAAPPPPPVAFPAITPEAAIAAAPAAQAYAAPAMGGTSGTVSKAASAAAPSRRSEVSEWNGWGSASDQALFRALNAGDLPSVRAAIAHGANVNAKDERGRTALQVARERVNADAVRALEAAGAR